MKLQDSIASNKRIWNDYNRFKDLKGRYNTGKIEGDNFILYRIKDGTVIRSFNIYTFLPTTL